MANEPRVSRKTLVAELAILAARFGTAVGLTSFEISRGGMTCEVRVKFPSKGSPYTTLFVEAWWRPEPKAADRPVVTFTAENSILRFAQTIGLNVKPPSRDPDFNHDVYTATRLDTGSVSALLTVDAREAVRTLLGGGWRKVQVLSKSIQASRPLTSLSMLKPELIESTLSALLAIAVAARSTAIPLPVVVPERLGDGVLFAIGLFGFFLLFVLMAQGDVPFLPGRSPRLVSTTCGGAVALIVTLVAAVRWRGRSTSLQDATTLAAILLVFCPLGFAAVLPWLNKWADPHPARSSALVVREFKQGRKTSPRLIFEPEEPGTAPIEVDGTFLRTPLVRRAGAPVTLLVGDGLFGWRYVVAVCVRGADCPGS